MSTTKRVYFVRHGETGGNREQRHQFPEVPLNKTGRDQAYRVGLALKEVGAQVILASHLQRAQDTAAIIADTIGGIPVEIDEDLREVRRASHIWGMRHFGLTSLRALFLFFFYGLFGNKRAYDEETLHEFATRIVTMVEKIEKREEDVLIVVTHRGVLSELPSLLRRNKKFTGFHNVLAFWGLYLVDNGEYTIADFDGTRWHVRKKNVNNHLR